MGDGAIIQLRARRTKGPAPDVLLKVSEAAERLKVSERTFYRWLKSRRPPPHVWIGPEEDILRVPVDALDAWWGARVVGG